jgi:hypothetical protein
MIQPIWLNQHISCIQAPAWIPIKQIRLPSWGLATREMSRVEPEGFDSKQYRCHSRPDRESMINNMRKILDSRFHGNDRKGC